MTEDSFLSVIPRDKDFIGGVDTGISLKVIQSDGVEVKPDVKFTRVDLSNGEKYFHNNSTPYASFSIKVITHSTDRIGNVTVNQALDYYIRHGIPFFVNTRAVALRSNVLYLITENSSRKQKYDDGYVEWNLTFTRYSEIPNLVFNNTNAGVKTALKMYARSKMTPQQKLAKCNRKQLVYTPKKKTVLCVKYLQQILYQKGFLKGKYSEVVDQWYSKRTKNAVKEYQKKYKKDGLVATGNLNASTFNHMCGIKVQIGKTIELKNNLPTANSDGIIDMTKQK